MQIGDIMSTITRFQPCAVIHVAAMCVARQVCRRTGTPKAPVERPGLRSSLTLLPPPALAAPTPRTPPPLPCLATTS
jgi:hypothetical protein